MSNAEEQQRREANPLPPAENQEPPTQAQPGGASSAAGGAAPTVQHSEQPTSNRDTFFRNLRAKYGEDLDEDSLFGKAMEGYDSDHEYNKQARANDAMLRELAAEDPEFNGLVKDFTETGDMAYAVQKNMPEGVANYGGENTEMRRQLIDEQNRAAAETEANLARQNENLAKSQEVLSQYVKDNNMSEADAKDFMGAVSDYVANFTDGIISPDFLTLLDKGRKFDETMKQVEEATKVAMRNTKIEEQRQMFAKNADGLPSEGRGSGERETSSKNDPDLDWLRQASARSRAVIPS